MVADEMVGAIRGNDLARLTKIPGIGKKTAERMVLELRDKLARRYGQVHADCFCAECDGRRRFIRADELGLPTRGRRKGLDRSAEERPDQFRQSRIVRRYVPPGACRTLEVIARTKVD